MTSRLAPRVMASALLIVLCGALVAVPTSAAPPPAPQWDHDEQLSSAEGYVQLHWIVPTDPAEEGHWVFQLQEGRRPVFADTDTRYDGPQTSSFVSGLEDGTTYFRVRARHVDEPDAWSEWSTTVHVEVKHHDRNFALMLMGLGAVVFVATAAFLIYHRNDPSPRRSAS